MVTQYRQYKAELQLYINPVSDNQLPVYMCENTHSVIIHN